MYVCSFFRFWQGSSTLPVAFSSSCQTPILIWLFFHWLNHIFHVPLNYIISRFWVWFWWSHRDLDHCIPEAARFIKKVFYVVMIRTWRIILIWPPTSYLLVSLSYATLLKSYSVQIGLLHSWGAGVCDSGFSSGAGGARLTCRTTSDRLMFSFNVARPHEDGQAAHVMFCWIWSHYRGRSNTCPKGALGGYVPSFAQMLLAYWPNRTTKQGHFSITHTIFYWSAAPLRLFINVKYP